MMDPALKYHVLRSSLDELEHDLNLAAEKGYRIASVSNLIIRKKVVCIVVVERP